MSRRMIQLLLTRHQVLPLPPSRESGVTAIEYALIAAFISIVIVASVTLVGTSVSTFFTKVGNGF